MVRELIIDIIYYAFVSNRLEKLSFLAYLGAAFVFMFAGVGPGRGLLIISTVLLAGHLIRERRVPEIPITACWAFGYLAWITLALMWGPTDSIQVNQIYRNLFWLNIPVAAMLVTNTERRKQVFAALAAGSVILAFRVFWTAGTTLWEAHLAGLGVDTATWTTRVFFHRELDDSDIISRLVSVGGMQDGQRLPIGLVALFVGGWLYAEHRRMKVLRVSAIFLVLLAFILSFKRGPWISFGLVGLASLIAYLMPSTTAVWLHKHWRGTTAAIMALVVGGFVWFVSGEDSPWSQTSQHIEQATQKGGRMCMWFEITPELVKQHPCGIGFKALSNEKMRSIAPHVERSQTHVHSNILQSLIDGGWIGMILFIGWMVSAVRDIILFKRQTSVGSADYVMSCALLVMFTSLLGMGLVEYQLGSGQMVLLYGALMGVAAGAARPVRNEGAEG